jgi:hypothetical protein
VPKKRPALMPHAQRRRLVEAPLAALGIRRIPSQATWAGVQYHELEVFFEGLFRKRGPQEFDEPAYEMDWEAIEGEVVV